MKQFWEVYRAYFIGMLLATVIITPFVKWMCGDWPNWVLWSELFTLPAGIAFIDTRF